MKEKINKLYNSDLSKDYPTYYDLLEYTTYIENQNKQLQEQNKSLQSQLKAKEEVIKEDYFKYYIQGSDHYLIPKDIFDELFNEMSNWKEDTKKYKEVIGDLIEYIENNKEEIFIGWGNNTEEIVDAETLLQILCKGVAK